MNLRPSKYARGVARAFLIATAIAVLCIAFVWLLHFPVVRLIIIITMGIGILYLAFWPTRD